MCHALDKFPLIGNTIPLSTHHQDHSHIQPTGCLILTMKILSILGTRPEAIKMAPVLRQLQRTAGVESIVCITGQHKNMLHQALDLFHIKADHDLDVMMPGQSLNALSASIFNKIDPVLSEERPDYVLVQGDTSTAGIAATAAFHRKIAIGHIEAGLRSGNISQPWPEEFNRRSIDVVSQMLFAPTPRAAENLHQENLQGNIAVTGNTIIDALLHTVQQLNSDPVLRNSLDKQWDFLHKDAKLILVTCHRRENFGAGINDLCETLQRLAENKDVQIVFPVHMNPHVHEPVMARLSGLANVHLTPPLDYLQFVRLMQLSDIILTDSGGIQEEAPSLGKPVLVMREVTERVEALAAGTVELVGTSPDRIVPRVFDLLKDASNETTSSPIPNPYGDGHAAERIVRILTGQQYQEFRP